MKKYIALCIIFLFYLWTATAGTYSFNVDIYKNDYRLISQYYYPNYLANAFLKGQLHLEGSPPKGLLELENPYDPDKNLQFRRQGLHDLSLYKGKIYSYFGPTPVICLFIPYKLITGQDLPCNLATMIFSFGVFTWLFLLLDFIKRKYFPKLPEWLFQLTLLAIGAANICPFMLRDPAIYEISVVPGVFFLLGATHLTCTEFDKPTRNNLVLMLISSFLGLAVGSRFYLIFPSILLLCFIYKHHINNLRKELISLITPFSILLGCLLVYNYLRFDSLFQNGNVYQLAYYHSKINFGSGFLTGDNPLNRILTYTFHPITISNEFPFIQVPYIRQMSMPQNIVKMEKIVGMFIYAPITLFIFTVPLLKYLRKNLLKDVHNFPSLELKLSTYIGIAILISLSMWSYITMRYAAEFISFFLLSTAIALFAIHQYLPRYKVITNIAVIVLACISIINGTTSSIVGPNQGLKKQNPQEFNKIKSWFQ